MMKQYPWLQIEKTATVAMTITSIVVAIIAFVDLQNASAEVSKVVAQWQRRPVVDVLVVKNGLSCPPSYSPWSLNGAKFSGLSQGSCACTQTPPTFQPTASPSKKPTTGNSNAAPTCPAPYCMTDPSESALGLNIWRGSTICTKVGGE